jgi:DNA transformation protein
MAVSTAYRDYLADLFAPLGDIKVNTMFGGAGVYHKGQFFALAIAERIYLKTDDQTRPAFEREGSKPFVYRTKDGEQSSHTYLELPARLLDDPDELRVWARGAYEAAVRAKGKKAPKKKGRPLETGDLPLVQPRKRKRGT